jgi:hypothetical protein
MRSWLGLSLRSKLIDYSTQMTQMGQIFTDNIKICVNLRFLRHLRSKFQ